MNFYPPMAERPQEKKRRLKKEKISHLRAQIFFWFIVLAMIVASCHAWANGG
jgi:hypothetical protein